MKKFYMINPGNSEETLEYIIKNKSCVGIDCYKCPVSNYMKTVTECTITTIDNILNRNKTAYSLAVKRYSQLYSEEKLFELLL